MDSVPEDAKVLLCRDRGTLSHSCGTYLALSVLEAGDSESSSLGTVYWPGHLWAVAHV